jgi:2-oxoglutarate dehydrogenase E2 component (dihydrolipoamide succinyltransferase)
MKVNVVMPKMGESINEGTIIKWHKKKGDKVKKDEVIFEISTDKVDTEIPAPEDGTLADIKVFEQETVPVDTVVAIIETNGGGSQQTEAKEQEETPKTQPEKKSEPASTKQVGGVLVDITMPKMGESITEGTILRWNKKAGEQIKRDEILFEISTDKVDTEVPSPVEGTVAEILTKEQETVPVGTVVARISSKSGAAAEQPAPKIVEPEMEAVEAESPKPAAQKSAPAARPQTAGSDKFYSPVVMSMAQKEGISFDELNSVEGTGLEGRVTKKDVLAYLENRKTGTRTNITAQPDAGSVFEEKPAQTVKTPTAAVPSGDVELIPMDNIRQKIMNHMVHSRDTSVHVSGIVEVDMQKIDKFIKNNKEDFLKRENIKLTYTTFVAYACVKALKEHPMVNSSIDGANIVQKRYVNLGIAVAVEPNGLIVPNIKRADEKNIKGLAKAIAELGQKARTKKLVPDDISNGTFTITNYGIFGTLFGSPIINQPEVAILGMGAVVKKPVVIDVNGEDTIAIRPMMYLSLSHDHRLIDGMLGGKFLKTIKDALENFDENAF